MANLTNENMKKAIDIIDTECKDNISEESVNKLMDTLGIEPIFKSVDDFRKHLKSGKPLVIGG